MLRKNPSPFVSDYFDTVTMLQTEKYATMFVINDDTSVDVEIVKKYTRSTSNMFSISGTASINLYKTKIAEISVDMISSVVSSNVVITILEDAIRKYDALLSE